MALLAPVTPPCGGWAGPRDYYRRDNIIFCTVDTIPTTGTYEVYNFQVYDSSSSRYTSYQVYTEYICVCVYCCRTAAKCLFCFPSSYFSFSVLSAPSYAGTCPRVFTYFTFLYCCTAVREISCGYGTGMECTWKECLGDGDFWILSKQIVYRILYAYYMSV